jgi:serine/threonine-protein kinase RsbW
MIANTKQVLSIEADLAELANVRGFIERAAQSHGVQGDALSDVRLAVDELITNTITHGYGDEKGQIEIELQFDSGQKDLIIILRDQAPIFDPFSNVPQYSVGEKLAQPQAGGFGLQLVLKAVNKHIHSVTDAGGNELTLIKHI